MSTDKWGDYYKKVNTEPRVLLVEALQYANKTGSALDLGCGASGDTYHLKELGYTVTSVDSSDRVLEYIPSAIISSFEQFPFPRNEYSVVNAQFALPFCSPNRIDDVFESIKESLQTGGIFTGQFFGPNDSWAIRSDMNFKTREQMQNLLGDLEIIKFEEEEKDTPTALGDPHHWHLFHIIARRS